MDGELLALVRAYRDATLACSVAGAAMRDASDAVDRARDETGVRSSAYHRCLAEFMRTDAEFDRCLEREAAAKTAMFAFVEQRSVSETTKPRRTPRPTREAPTMTPLNGTKTHPLSRHALGVLRDLLDEPRPAQEVNPGVVNRLEREDLVRRERRPSPYKTRKGDVDFLVITDAGRAALARDAAKKS